MNNKVLNVVYDGNYNLNLPSTEDLTDGFKFTLTHDVNDTDKGTITPYSGQTINGKTNKEVYSSGFLSLTALNGVWFIENQSLFKDEPLQGKTKEVDFTNQTEITVVHDLGYIPIVEVYVEYNDTFIKSNAYVEHNWNTKNEFTIKLSQLTNGKVIYF